MKSEWTAGCKVSGSAVGGAAASGECAACDSGPLHERQLSDTVEQAVNDSTHYTKWD